MCSPAAISRLRACRPNREIRTIFLFLSLVSLAFHACGKPQPPSDLLARVGDATFTEEDLKARLPLGVDQELIDAQRTQLIENWVQEELLYQEALRRRLDQDARIHALLVQARRDLLTAALLDEEFADQEIHIDEASIQAYYQDHAGEFQRPLPEIHIRHILLASRRDANAKRQALQRGESFEDLARKYSLDPDSRLKGGDLGYFSEAQDPILWEACQSLPLHRISKPIRTEYGYHLIQVLDRQEAGTVRPLEQVRELVVEALVRQRHQEKVRELVDRLKAASDWLIVAPARTDSL